MGACKTQWHPTTPDTSRPTHSKAEYMHLLFDTNEASTACPFNDGYAYTAP